MVPSALLIACVDGRIQLPLQRWVRTRIGVDLVDTITEPGADLVLSVAYGAEPARIRSVAEMVARRRPPRVIVVAGHHDCLANPVTKHRHIGDIRAAASTASRWRLAPLVVGVWVDERWEIEEICEVPAPDGS